MTRTAEELARKALKGAREAGIMTLLLDREAAGEADLLTLSVRYLQDTGEAVERLLLVRDARNSNESPDDFVLDVWTRFEELCKSVALDFDFYPCLAYLSARDCGPLGPAFVKLLKEKLGSHLVVVTSTSVPLDRRVVLACYERTISRASSCTQIDVLVDFFNTIDRFRLTEDYSCKCLLGSQRLPCSHSPWLTYTSSIAYLLKNQDTLASSHECVLSDSLMDPQFLVCLSSFGSVFSEINLVSQLMTKSCFDFEHYRFPVIQSEFDGASKCCCLHP